MSRRHWLLAASLALCVWLAMSGDSTPASGMSTDVNPLKSGTKATQSARPTQVAAATESSVDVLEIQVRTGLVGGTGTGVMGHKLFDSLSWTPAPAAPARPAPLSAPELPYTYVGKKFDGVQWEVYLVRGDESFVAREQTVLQSAYRITSIRPPTLSLIYLPLNQMQDLPIGDEN